MAESNLKSPLVKGDSSDLTSLRTSSTQLFKSMVNLDISLGVKDDFNKATGYLRDLRPQMIDTPFKGSSLVMSKDERYYVFGSREGRIGIADRETKQVIVDKDLGQGSIWALALIENDNYILSAGASGTIKKFEYKTLNCVDEFEGHTDEINFIKVRSDEKFMYSGSDDYTIREWDMTLPKGSDRSKVLYSHNRTVYCVDLSLDGTYIASGSGDSTVKIYNLDEGVVVAHMTEPSDLVWAVKISAMKSFVIGGDEAHEIHVWKFGSWERVKVFRGHTARVRYLDFAMDESFIVSAGLDHTIKVWDMKQNRKEITLKGHKDWVKFALIDKSQHRIFSISDDCKVSSWWIPEFDSQVKFEHEQSFSRLDTSSTIVYGRTDSSIVAYDLGTGKNVQNISLDGIEVVSYSFGTSSHLHVFANDNSDYTRKYLVWDLATGNQIRSAVIDIDEMFCALLYNFEKQVAIGQTVRVCIFNISDMTKLHTFRSHKVDVRCLGVTYDNNRLYSADSEKIVKFYDLSKKEEIGNYQASDSINFIQVSLDNEHLFICEGQTLAILTTRRMHKVTEISDFTSSKIYFTEDRNYFVYHSSEAIHFKDINNFQLINSINFGHPVSTFAFSVDENLIITTSGDNSTIFTNPMKCKKLAIYGDLEKTYEYIEYLNNVMQSKAKHDPQYDSWIIEPFHINALHLYAHSNQPAMLSAAISSCSPFYPSRTGHTPLEIALNKRFMDCVDSIYKASKTRLDSGDEYAFYYFGNSLISLNTVGYENLHKIYQICLRKCLDPTLPKFLDDSIILPFEVNSESPVVDQSDFPDAVFSQEGTAIVFAKSLFRVSLKVGSQDSTDLLESIINCPNEKIYSTQMIQMILKSKWHVVRKFLIFQGLLYFTYLVLLSLYSTLYETGDFLIWPFAVSSILFVNEAFQMYYDGWEYFEDVWNYIDVIRAVLLIVYSVEIWAESAYLKDFLLVLLVLFSWLRGISYFRIIRKTRYLIKLIMAATADISAFFIILFYSTIAFALIYQSMNREGDMLTFFLNSFKMNLGDLGSGEASGVIGTVMFIIVSIINPVIMLNLLISIMGDTYGRVKEGEVVADARQLAEMILEVEGIMGWRRSLNEMFFVKILCEESYLSVEDETIEGQIAALEEKVQELLTSCEADRNEVKIAIQTELDPYNF